MGTVSIGEYLTQKMYQFRVRMETPTKAYQMNNERLPASVEELREILHDGADSADYLLGFVKREFELPYYDEPMSSEWARTFSYIAQAMENIRLANAVVRGEPLYDDEEEDEEDACGEEKVGFFRRLGELFSRDDDD